MLGVFLYVFLNFQIVKIFKIDISQGCGIYDDQQKKGGNCSKLNRLYRFPIYLTIAPYKRR